MEAMFGERFGVTILGSGSKGNATLVHRGKDAVLIDAGFSCREFKRRLEASGLPSDLRIHGILVTHEHTDHANGIRLVSQKFDAPIYATSKCASVLRQRYNIDFGINLIAPGGSFQLSQFQVMPFTIPHDSVDPVAFTLAFDGYKVGIATDIGNANNVVAYELRNCDVLVLESNHDLNMLAGSQRPWPLKQRIMGNMGHLSNESTCKLLERVMCPNLRHLVLAHISSECNSCDKARCCVENCLVQLSRTDIELSIATQDEPVDTIWL